MKKCLTVAMAFVLLLAVLSNIEKISVIQKLKKYHNLDIIPIKMSTIRDYLFLDENTILVYTGGSQMSKIDLKSKKSTAININIEDKIDTITGMFYDNSTNMVFLNVIIIGKDTFERRSFESRFYLLFLDDYQIKEVPELKNIVYQFYYSTIEKVIYFNTNEGINIFDIGTSNFREKINFPENVTVDYLDYFGGFPLQILTTYSADEGNRYFYLWQDKVGSTFFSDINMAPNTRPTLADYIALGGGRFLCINCRGPDDYIIVELNLPEGKITPIDLNEYTKGIYFLKKISNKKFGFIMPFKRYTLFCMFDYDETMEAQEP
jgi:hypothetical protein